MEWQPIESAPRDGTRILAGRKGWVSVVAWNPDFHAHSKSKAVGVWMDDDGDFGPDAHDWPTHWMPLPAPPIK